MTPGKIVVYVIAFLLGLNWVMGRWIHRELQGSFNAVAESAESKVVEEKQSYDLETLEGDGEQIPQESGELPATGKAKPRERDEKIIYEMPISERNLLQ